ncbi:PREDICTED: premnaspirodiene oxygenase-like [Ipomoea nil]|uniref:premnaspirodiene oxygenase-like n=1 Tax=Ipomoea nil TaxID=35883 RepID=UPI000901E09E|nr:PREDICTED: premnaspirodiene oxygenase-like [Ipomoea nil]
MENLISFALFVSFLVLVYTQWKKQRRGKMPPGPRKLPIIGNLLHITGPVLPHRALRDLARKYGGLMSLQIGEISAVVVSSPDMAKEFLRTHDLAFATRAETLAGSILLYNNSDIVLGPYGDYWRQMRKICITELLNPRLVRSFSSIRHDEIHRLLADVRSSAGRPFNVSERIFLFTSSIICRAAFGEVFDGREQFIQQTKDISVLTGSFDFADMFPSWKALHPLFGNKSEILKTHRKTDSIIESIINDHRNKLESGTGEDCIIDVLLKLMDSGNLQVPITHDNIKAIIIDMFGAGSETSTTTSMWAMSEMMKNPRVLAKAQAEVREVFKGKEMLEESDVEQLPYLKTVVKETLRCHPPTPLIATRECREETVINGGYTIPVKTKVMVNAYALATDPQYWEEPERFIPERFEDNGVDFNGSHFQYVPFGAGRRICPGLAFGFANTISPLAHLLYNFDWKLPEGVTAETLDMTEMLGLAVARKNDLILIPSIPSLS